MEELCYIVNWRVTDWQSYGIQSHFQTIHLTEWHSFILWIFHSTIDGNKNVTIIYYHFLNIIACLRVIVSIFGNQFLININFFDRSDTVVLRTIQHARIQEGMNVWSLTTQTASIGMMLAYTMKEGATGIPISVLTDHHFERIVRPGFLLLIYDLNNKAF